MSIYEAFWCQVLVAMLLHRMRQIVEGEHGKMRMQSFSEYISYDWWDESD